jgi:hypothetical protein
VSATHQSLSRGRGGRNGCGEGSSVVIRGSGGGLRCACAGRGEAGLVGGDVCDGVGRCGASLPQARQLASTAADEQPLL